MLDGGVWRPDAFAVEAARAGQLCIAALAAPDRAWIVASLAVVGLTAEDAAKALSCSLRTIRQIRSEPAAQIARFAVTNQVHLEAAVETERAARRFAVAAASAAQNEMTRLVSQRNILIDQLATYRKTGWSRPLS